MATSLQAQLARIAANSTNSLDLRAQRKAHSQSLLFEPKIAASQDFDALYHICIQGFYDLCQVDARFSRYSKSLFSEQSKEQDRTQLTSSQNDELDALLEDFLSLVGGRLLLAPAIRAVEWLIRRFKIHELNTQATVLTFLPYHSEAFFSALLSIVPEKLPQSIRFLSAYREHARNPSRQSIVVAAIQNSHFFQAFNRTVVDSAKRNHSYAQLSDFWSSVTTEALAGQLDMAATGRMEARSQKEDDVLLAILPTLNDCLSMKNSSLRRGSYTMMILLASRLQLPDRTLDAMMEAVANVTGPQLGENDLICLAVLAKHRRGINLPKVVSRLILTVPRLETKLQSLNQKYNLERLVVGVVLAAINRLDKSNASEGLDMVEKIIRIGLLGSNQMETARTVISKAIENYDLASKVKPGVRDRLVSISMSVGNLDTQSLGQTASDENRSEGQNDDQDGDILTLELSSSSNTAKADTSETEFESQLFNIPDYSAELSFLRRPMLISLSSLDKLCSLAGSSTQRWSSIQKADCFQGEGGQPDVKFLTFLMRFWCGTSRYTARRQAIIVATDILRERSKSGLEDQQFILPYALVALSDSFARVRNAAVGLVRVINQSLLNKNGQQARFGKNPPLYGSTKDHHADLFADSEAVAALSGVIVQHLEECVQDRVYIGKLLQACLEDGRMGNTQIKVLSDRAKETIFAALAAHTICTPAMSVKMKLLQLVHGTGKTKNKSKATLLLPLLQSLHETSTDELRKTCQLEMLDREAYITEVVGVASIANKLGRRLLCHIITDSSDHVSNDVRLACLELVQKSWSQIKAEHHQHEIVSALFQIVWQETPTLEFLRASEKAADILRSVSLHPKVLCDLLVDLPALTVGVEETASPTKRRKTENGHVESQHLEAGSHMNWVLQRWTFVLELIEGSQDRASPDLASRLCMLLSDIHTSTATIGSKATYLQSLLLDSCNGTIKDLAQKETTINPNVVPVESIVDIFKTSTNAQVQQAALLLISTLAKLFPDVTVHHIMPVFTKMGESVLQHSDEYSVHVSNLAISAIIPPLLASFDRQKGGSQEGMVRLLVSFVAAFEHMPYDRRLPLFLSLTEQLGPGSALYLLLLLFLDRFGRNKAVEDFVAELFSYHDAADQLIALNKAVHVILDALSEYPSPLVSHILPAPDAKSRLAAIHHIVVVTARITQDNSLLRKASQELSREGSRIRSAYSQLSEQILRFSSSVRTQKKLFQASETLMDAALKLLPVHETISGLETLLSSGEDAVLRRTVKSIEDRVRVIGTGDTTSQAACLELLPKLCRLLQDREDQGLLQICISCLDSIIERFGKRDASLTKDVLQTLAGKKFIASADKQTVQISLLCLASAIQTLGEALVAILPGVVQLTLGAMKESVELSVHTETINASYALFAAVLDSMPWVLSKTHMEELLRISAVIATSPSLREATIDNRLAALELLARKVEPRDVLAPLTNTWLAVAESPPHLPATDVATKSIDALLQHLQVARAIINTNSKSSVVRHSRTLLAFFVQVLDLPSRQLHLSEKTHIYSVSEVGELIDVAAENMVAMVFKLNDAAFRPLFSALLDWANETKTNSGHELSSMPRHFALYTFLARFFGTLKSIVTSYAGLIVDDATGQLLQKPTQTGQTKVYQEYEHGLWCRALETLRLALDNDADEYFQAPARFGPLCNALVLQIEQMPALATRASAIQHQQQDDDVQETLEGHVIPAIVALASAADAAENAKTLNKAVLREMRNQRASVRVSAIRCQQVLVEKLSEDWLSNLPEMLPVIGEVLEDEDEEVVGEARRWVTAIEAILGESLEGMLQ